MKPIDRSEVLGLAEYEEIRERFRSRVIAEKKLRRLQLGPKASALFENRDTILLQIQEMLRTERITRPAAIQHEIDTYNENLPGDDELSCTVMFEIPEKAERDEFLRAAAGVERHVWLIARGTRIAGRAIQRDGILPDRATAVLYLKFSLPKSLAETLRGGQRPDVSLEVDHPAYAACANLERATIEAICEDLRGD
ncbi:MAG: DUF3501 family protein [Polyangiaceae bacterium]|nr:DUF3501 family protein [Polyangiaceae bacterium]